MTRQRALHPAERKYMVDAASGLTADQSARRHGVTVNTVRTALQHAKLALGASNITHAVVLALKYGEFTINEIGTGS